MKGIIKMQYESTSKKISVFNIKASGACKESLYKFAYLVFESSLYSFDDEVEFHEAMIYAEKCKGGVDFLITMGFIKLKPESKKYTRGDKFLYDNEKYMLSRVALKGHIGNIFALISIKDGLCWDDSISFSSSTSNQITEDQFKQLTGPHKFIKIEE